MRMMPWMERLAAEATEDEDKHLLSVLAATPANRQKSCSDRQRALGRAPRLLYLTDAELAEVKTMLRKLRALVP